MDVKVAALIPARKESRRLPGKNWRQVGNRPLWAHAVDHAKLSGVCDPVVVSTDDETIHKHALTMGVITIDQPKFPQTYNVMLEVVKHADSELVRLGFEPEAICLLQPTSPLRQPYDVEVCVHMLSEGGVGRDSVVSVTEAEDDIAFAVRHANRLERLPRVVRPNGAIYVVRTDVLRTGGSWYSDFAYAYTMPKERSIDIDNEVDLEMAQAAWTALHASRSE